METKKHYLNKQYAEAWRFSCLPRPIRKIFKWYGIIWNPSYGL